MAVQQLNLISGSYTAKNLIANAQRCINLYPERNPEDAPSPYTHYLTPGLTLLSPAPTHNNDTTICRGAFYATDGYIYVVSGQYVSQVDSLGNWVGVGKLLDNLNTPVSFAENGLCIVLVDGSSHGYAISMGASPTMKLINDPGFYGADKVDYIDTFFIFNRPGTQQWYKSLSNITYALFSAGTIPVGSITAAGSGYYPSTPSSTYFAVPFASVSGAGSGAIADITVFRGQVVQVANVLGGAGYKNGDVLTATLGGQINTVTYTYFGTGADGIYLGVPMIGGSGHQAAASITILSNEVMVVNFTGVSQSVGLQYKIGDVLTTAAFGGNMFLTVKVTGIVNNGSGFQYTVSDVTSQAFYSLDIAAKTGYPDNLVSLIVMHREIWLLGERTTEVWYNSGAADFTFGIVPGAFVEHGILSKYSLARQDLQIFWLSRDKEGNGVVMTGTGYQAKRISTHAIEQEFAKYVNLTDAVGSVYQQSGHVFYVLDFPTDNKTWVYDVATELWHQRASIDSNGNLNQVIAGFYVNQNTRVLAFDKKTSDAYILDEQNQTENGNPIERIRSLPHLKRSSTRVAYKSLILEFAGGNPGSDSVDDRQVSLRWSDDGGFTFNTAQTQTIGATGYCRTNVKWNRLGLARDRVFEVSWSGNITTALNSAVVDLEESET